MILQGPFQLRQFYNSIIHNPPTIPELYNKPSEYGHTVSIMAAFQDLFQAPVISTLDIHTLTRQLHFHPKPIQQIKAELSMNLP